MDERGHRGVDDGRPEVTPQCHHALDAGPDDGGDDDSIGPGDRRSSDDDDDDDGPSVNMKCDTTGRGRGGLRKVKAGDSVAVLGGRRQFWDSEDSRSNSIFVTL